MNITEAIELDPEKASRMFSLPAVAAALQMTEADLIEAVRAEGFARPESAFAGAWRWSQAAIEYEIKKRYLGHEPCGFEINWNMAMAVEAAIQRAEKVGAGGTAP